MKITRLTTYRLPPRWMFLKIETDEGVTGWGEPVVEGRAESVAALVGELADYLIGADPRRIEDHWSVLYRGGFYRGGPHHMSALAGIDQALWDILGKWMGQPVHALMGGRVRDRIAVYSWIGGDRPDDVVAAAREQAARGFGAIKMNATAELGYLDSHGRIDAVAERVGGIRDALGPDFGIAVDFHGRVHRAMAKALVAALDPFRCLFFEEPVLSENAEALGEIARHSTTPIALGERLYSRWDVKPILAAGHVDVLQPDISHAGGLSECRKIATMAEAHDVALAPHCPLGPITLAASLQLDAVSPNAFIQEQSLGIHYNEGSDLLDYLSEPAVFAYAEGHVAIPDGPGLGIEIDESKVRAAARTGHRWRNPVWRLSDGSVAEW